MDGWERQQRDRERAQAIGTMCEEVAWQHGGMVESFTFRRKDDHKWQLSITAVSKKGKFYVLFYGESPESCLDDVASFLSSNGHPAKWRASTY